MVIRIQEFCNGISVVAGTGKHERFFSGSAALAEVCGLRVLLVCK